MQTFENETEQLVHITIDGEKISTTPKHPFYVPQKGWTCAIELKAGDILQMSNGKYVTVEQVQHEILEEPVKVYNFEVVDFHTYHVGVNSVLVHNVCENETLYHYTNEKGMNGILESGKLNPSLKANNPKDARYGDGQYLSNITPEGQTPIALAKKFIHRPNIYKYTRYIEIDVTGLNVIKGREGVFVIPNDSPLDLTNRIISTGIVGKK